MSTGRIFATIAAIALTLALGGPLAAASEGSSKSADELRKAMLTSEQIAESAGMQYPVGPGRVGCGVNAGEKATYCQYPRLGSRQSRVAGEPWASHLAIVSFDTQADAQAFLERRRSTFEGARVITSTSAKFVAYQLDSQLNYGFFVQVAPQASAFHAVGSHVVFAACADSRRPIISTAVVECADALASAQASEVG